ncbi:hypothetical protein ASZ90_001686 [hydrocarbon metagenome]|uniref:Uncharacterized protein n=1 Tax=hydrocarbon metagenome TaxID=938273 RepID=A0A0W8G5R3_9ZZZZ
MPLLVFPKVSKRAIFRKTRHDGGLAGGLGQGADPLQPLGITAGTETGRMHHFEKAGIRSFDPGQIQIRRVGCRENIQKFPA